MASPLGRSNALLVEVPFWRAGLLLVFGLVLEDNEVGGESVLNGV
jgi:hypothetical protein